jgi:hypothetical protein
MPVGSDGASEEVGAEREGGEVVSALAAGLAVALDLGFDHGERLETGGGSPGKRRSVVSQSTSWLTTWRRIFPNSDACCRLIRALAVETHENWLEALRYLNMNELNEHKKTQLRQAA